MASKVSAAAINFCNLHSSGLKMTTAEAPINDTDTVISSVLGRMDIATKDDTGAICQVYSVMCAPNDNLATKKLAIKSIIEAGLAHDASATKRVAEWQAAGFPELFKYGALLTYRYILKNIPYNTMLALAMGMSAPWIIDRIMLHRIQSGGWAGFDNEYGFSESEIRDWVVLSLDSRIIANAGGVSTNVTEACGWFPQGPFPTGYGNNITISKPSIAATTIPSSNTQGVTPMTNAIASMNPQVKTIVDGMLTQAGVNLTLDKIMEEMAMKATVLAEFTEYKAKSDEEITKLRRAASTAAAMPSTINLVNSGVGGIPDGKMEMVDAGSIFPMLKANGKLMIPKFTWDAHHPDVPVVDQRYVFRKQMLIGALRCLVSRENAWFVGHTGSGKTTIVEQIAALLGWPVARVAFDSNVDRSELVGRMSLKGDGKGGTVSEWIPGILERATTMGYILLCDEIDAGHPNALYTLQPVLEGKPLTLLEDGGRVVPRHPMCRVFATGNTTGNGDPSGLYPACRILSAATLDRFPNFINVPYMSQDEEVRLISEEVPGLAPELVQRLAKFATEMRQAFISNQTPVSYSPRRSVAFAREVDFYYNMGFKDEAKILSTAFKSKLYDAASEEFRQRITEIANAALGKIDPTKTVV